MILCYFNNKLPRALFTISVVAILGFALSCGCSAEKTASAPGLPSSDSGTGTGLTTATATFTVTATDSGTTTGTVTITATGTASDTSTGTITVLPDPGADFGEYVDSTDKWHIKFDQPALFSALTQANIQIESAGLVKQKTIEYLNQYFNGLPISFSTAAPESGDLPSPGDRLLAENMGPTPYNMIHIRAIGSETATGRAIMDESLTNNWIENDSEKIYSGENLGVFVDIFTGYFETSITQGVDDFAKFLSVTTAHEIGHSLGLVHTDETTHIMNPVSILNPAITYTFSQADINFLTSILPGPSRN